MKFRATRSASRRFASAGMLLALVAGAAAAGEVCVGDSATLVAALQLGELQTQGYTIKLQQGSYFLSQYDSLSYQLNAPTSIEGGYTAGCGSRQVNAANTSVFLPASLQLEQKSGNPQAAIAFDGITFRGGSDFEVTVGEDVNEVLGFFNAGTLTVTNTRFTQISASAAFLAAPVFLQSIDGETYLDNVQFDHLQTQSSCAVYVAADYGGYTRVEYVTADLTGAGTHDFCFGTYFGGSALSGAQFENSIVWGSDGSAPKIAEKRLDNQSVSWGVADSIVAGITGKDAPGSSNVVNADPGWVAPASNDYHLGASSPAINHGYVDAFTPSTDIAGNPRWVGSTTDIGAYESSVNDNSSFIVTNTNDSGPGSLRAAIVGANSLPNPATIGFSIQSADPCPSVIQLDSALPPITSPVIIDGYSQQGSSPNGDADAFDAQLCILIKPTSGTLASAFTVPAGADSASLTLRGVGLGGFSQAVLLLGGKNHVIAGNQFGGTIQGVPLGGATLSAISFGVNAGGTLVVGGNSVADRNLIGGVSAGPAVRVQSTVQSDTAHCQVVNNLIGLAADGITALPNFAGIILSGNGCALFRNRIAGNLYDGIDVYGSNNLVQRNVIGIGADDGGYANAGIGIDIAGYDNVIGIDAYSNTPVALFGNVVRHMGAGGVAVESSGGGNSIRSNLVYGNAAGIPAIDLGADGATANNAGVQDSGPNRLQPYPLVDGLYFAATPHGGDTSVPATIAATLASRPGSYHLDAYFASACNGTRGDAEAYLGTTSVTIGAGASSVTFALAVTLPAYGAGYVVSLVATDPLGNSSEIGDCFPVSAGKDDTIFRDGLGN